MTIQALRALATKDALEACSKLDAATRQRLFVECPASDHRILLVLNVIDKMYMDDGFTGGISGETSNARGGGSSGDYGAVRTFLLQKRKTMSQAHAGVAKDAAWHRWFYPEYRGITNLRERFARIAEDHTGLNYKDPMQIPFFSLNGYFNWDQAAQSAHTWTTCALFVRACRATARILEQKAWTTNTPSGTDACIVGPGQKANVIYAQRAGREPRRGDIFHVMTPGRNNAHVGIILRHRVDPLGNWIWTTAEGGQGEGYETRLKENHTVAFKSGKHWHGTGANQRPIIKWIDLEELARSIPPPKSLA
jgi:hypothetical protein